MRIITGWAKTVKINTYYMVNLNKYELLTFEKATRILYYNFSTDAKAFKSAMEDLMISTDKPHKHIAPAWYENYQQYLIDNKNEH